MYRNTSTVNIVHRPRQFNLALRDLFAQSINVACSASNPELNNIGYAELDMMADLGFRGRGKASFVVPPEVLDQPLRRPGTSAPAPLGHHETPKNCSSPAKLIPLDHFFTGEPIDEFELYRVMEKFILNNTSGLNELEQMMEYLSEKALDSDRNVPTICKYLYVFSKDPVVGDDVRSAFYKNLEKNFMGREELRQTEGPTRYRNFIRWIMAAAHHFRNLLYAPFDELLLGLLALADEISSFNDSEDIPLYCTLILRFYYYSTLPQSDGTLVSVQLGKQHQEAVDKARDVIRRKLARGGLSAVQTGWLCLVLEATWSPKYLEDKIVAYYENILPSFSLVHLKSLNIRLPKNHGREKYLEHIKEYIITD